MSPDRYFHRKNPSAVNTGSAMKMVQISPSSHLGGTKSAMMMHVQEPMGSNEAPELLDLFISNKHEYDEYLQLQAERDMLQKQLDKLIGDNDGQENNELALMVDDHILDEPLQAIEKQNLNEPSEDLV